MSVVRSTDPTDANTWGRPTQIAILATATAVGLATLLVALEGLVALVLLFDPGDRGPAFWRTARREYYMLFERQIVQYLPECAGFDPQLGYRLKPGRCRFHNREYDDEIVVNSAGMRDSEAALHRPEIVVTGDSFAMGWGVTQNETIAAVLGELTGSKVLNASEPSYGTAREMLLLQEVDLAAARVLVIQYCENDFVENTAFLRNQAHLTTMNPAMYGALVEDHRAATRYWPGKHVLHLLVPLLRWATRAAVPPPEVRGCDVDTRVFLDVLDRAALRGSLRVIAFEGTYTADQRSCFARELTRLVAQRPLPRWVSELRVIEPSVLLDASDYYPLDQHWKASGHRKLAHAIAEVLADFSARI